MTKWSVGFCQGKVNLDEKSFREVGADNYEEGLNKAKKLIEWVYQGIQAIQTRDGLRGALDSCPPMSKREELIALFVATGLPHLVRSGLQIAAKRAAATIPAQKGGRPPAIAPQQTGEVLDCVSALMRKGCSLEAAIYRTAQRFGSSERTIARLWARRGSISDDELMPEVTMDEAIDFITSGGESEDERLWISVP